MRPLLICALLMAASAVRGEENPWRKLPPPPVRADGVSGIALEGDTLWAMFQNVVYWDGKEWHKPTGPELRGGMYVTQFLGGGDKPLYCTQPKHLPRVGARPMPEQGQIGLLLKLEKGEATLVTEFPYERDTAPPGIFVSRDEIIINCIEQKLAVYDDKQWIERAAPEGRHLVFDCGVKVYVYYPQGRKLFTIGDRNQVTERDIELPFAERTFVKGARWGEHFAVILEDGVGPPPARILHLETGKVTEAKVPKLNYYEVGSTLDGAAWLLAYGPKGGLYFRHLAANGDFTDLAETQGIEWNGTQFLQSQRGMLQTNAGDVWIGGHGHPLIQLSGMPKGDNAKPNAPAPARALRQMGPETGFDLSNCTDLAMDSRGNLYASNVHGIYVKFAAEPPKHLSAPVRAVALQELWKWKAESTGMVAAWNVEGAIVAATNDRKLTSLDSEGKVLFQIAVKDEPRGISSPWLLPSKDKNRLKLASPKGIHEFDAKSGQQLSLLEVQFDSRIAPAPFGTGYLIVPGGRGESVVAVDAEGRSLWNVRLPGYVMLHPTVQGNYAIFQTRQGSYGGQATACVDAKEGRIAWQEQTDAYGAGAVFAQNGKLVVEANQFMSPQKTDGWLICREAASGKRLWEARRDGLIFHPPMVDAGQERVYAVFSRGEVVCFNAADGKVVWEQKLGENALSDGSANSYSPAWSPHSIQRDILFAVDGNRVLHALDLKSGRIEASILLASAPREKLVGPPAMIGDAIVVPLSTQVKALRCPQELR